MQQKLDDEFAKEDVISNKITFMVFFSFLLSTATAVPPYFIYEDKLKNLPAAITIFLFMQILAMIFLYRMPKNTFVSFLASMNENLKLLARSQQTISQTGRLPLST